MSEYTNQNLSNINIIALISHITGVHKGIKVKCSGPKTEKLWEIFIYLRLQAKLYGGVSEIIGLIKTSDVK